MLVRPNLWCILLLAFVKAASELVADDTFTDRNQLHAGNAESKINKEELILVDYPVDSPVRGDVNQQANFNQSTLANFTIATEVDSGTDEDEASDLDSHEGDDNSDVSEERNPLDVAEAERLPDLLEPVVSMISQAFSNKKSFSCPRIKTDLKTGKTIGDLSPEDIRIIASMGDGIASGVGLFTNTEIEFRGAAFASGGDATIDGLVTIPNILREFSPNLIGVSHGMGSYENLPFEQLSVSTKGATTKSMPKQAIELVRRLQLLPDVDYRDHWVMIIIAVGTEEVCTSCGHPDMKALREALDYLRAAVPKAFIVLLGPMHVASFYEQKKNIVRERCECSRSQPPGFMSGIGNVWAEAFRDLQEYVDDAANSAEFDVWSTGFAEAYDNIEIPNDSFRRIISTSE